MGMSEKIQSFGTPPPLVPGCKAHEPRNLERLNVGGG